MIETKQYIKEFANIVGMELNEGQLHKWYLHLKELIETKNN